MFEFDKTQKLDEFLEEVYQKPPLRIQVHKELLLFHKKDLMKVWDIEEYLENGWVVLKLKNE